MCSIDKLLIKGVRSFSPSNQHVIEFYRPLTLIVGQNGAGKTVRFGSAIKYAFVVPYGCGNFWKHGRCIEACRQSPDGPIHMEAVPSADRHRVLEASLHGRAAAQMYGLARGSSMTPRCRSAMLPWRHPAAFAMLQVHADT